MTAIDLFLWAISLIGGWNLINFGVRVYYKEVSYHYSWHIILGVWAAILLWIT